jgi:hypothetical protein
MVAQTVVLIQPLRTRHVRLPQEFRLAERAEKLRVKVRRVSAA